MSNLTVADLLAIREKMGLPIIQDRPFPYQKMELKMAALEPTPRVMVDFTYGMKLVAPAYRPLIVDVAGSPVRRFTRADWSRLRPRKRKKRLKRFMLRWNRRYHGY